MLGVEKLRREVEGVVDDGLGLGQLLGGRHLRGGRHDALDGLGPRCDCIDDGLLTLLDVLQDLIWEAFVVSVSVLDIVAPFSMSSWYSTQKIQYVILIYEVISVRRPAASLGVT